MSSESTTEVSTDTKEAVEILRKIGESSTLSAATKKRMAALVVGKNAEDVPSYYKEDFAKELQPALDDIMVTKEDCEFLFADYPRLNRKTLYLKIYYGWKYLMDKLDTDGRYMKLRGDTRLNLRKTGVRIRFAAKNEPMRAVKIKEVKHADLRERIDKFIMTGTVGQELLIEKIVLKEEDAEEIIASISNIECLVWSVTTTRIKLIKVTEEQWDAWRKS